MTMNYFLDDSLFGWDDDDDGGGDGLTLCCLWLSLAQNCTT